MRFATYTVAGATTTVELVLDPEHVLDVMDLAGNPAYSPAGLG